MTKEIVLVVMNIIIIIIIAIGVIVVVVVFVVFVVVWRSSLFFQTLNQQSKMIDKKQ